MNVLLFVVHVENIENIKRVTCLNCNMICRSQLCFDRIGDNTGMRSLCKVMLNSLWGRFTMRENLPQTQVNQDGKFLFKLLADNNRVLKGIHIMSEDYAQIEWSNNDDFQGTNSATYICRHFHNG
jgi:hypothetical protein